MRRLAVALVHFPVQDGDGNVVTTAVTSVDIHDIARSARTYGVERYYLIHPVEAARELVQHVQRSWLERSPSPKNEARREALARLCVVTSLEEAVADWGADRSSTRSSASAASGATGGNLGANCEVWGTSARPAEVPFSFGDARSALAAPGPAVLILFGTGNGLAPSALDLCARQIEPIAAALPSGYRHLSVRAAVAVVLDRLLGVRP
jgi:hypothetical protein